MISKINGLPLHIINFEEIAYHQGVALYIIKPQEDTRYRVTRCKGGAPPLMIYRLASDDMPSLGLTPAAWIKK